MHAAFARTSTRTAKRISRCKTAAFIVLVCAPLALAKDVESERFDNKAFYDGLIELHLLDLLDEQLAITPPTDPLTRLLLERKVKLVVAQSENIDLQRRQAALGEANGLLTRMIKEHRTDPRALEWQLELGRSLIYVQAEPYYTNILYRGGTAKDRDKLRELMAEATIVLERLRSFLDTEYARIDDVSLAEYERLDESGYVRQLEQALPQTDYMLRWAKFYTAIGYEDAAPQSTKLLEEVLEDLGPESELLRVAHTVSHVQAQSLLLAGMTSRRLGDDEPAVRYLRDAAEVVTNLPDPRERRDLQWLVLLASVERVRALRDRERYDEAVTVLRALQEQLAESGGADFGRRLVLAMLETSVLQARAGATKGDDPLSHPLADAAVGPLEKLAREEPAYRDEVYATIYEQAKSAADPQALHPLQQCALIAGLIADATRLLQTNPKDAPANTDARRKVETDAMGLLDRAIALATGLIERPAEERAGAYRCEAIFNLGVAQHLRGRRVEAVNRFVAVAQSCPAFDRALSAATYAVEIAADMAEDPSLRGRRDVRALLIEALRTLIDGFPDSDAVRYWRFFYAQALEDSGEDEAASRQYAQVERNHPHRLVARFRAGRCLASAVADYAAEHADETGEIRRRANAAQAALADFSEEASRATTAEDTELTKSARAEAEVLFAEVGTLPGVDEAEAALERLAGFEERYPDEGDLIGRVLRVRIIAYEATGQLAEAEQAVPRYIASAPEQAGQTLQALFDATWKEVARYRERGALDEANAKAKSALLFAEQLYRWATQSSGSATAEQVHALRLQLAEARLAAGNATDALPLITETVAFDAKRQPDGVAHDPRVLMAQARALEQLDRHAEALPVFNRVYREAPNDSSTRYEALLGDLRCRTQLGENPAQIIKVIQQHRFLNPDLGGEQLRRQFADLQARNESRARG